MGALFVYQVCWRDWIQVQFQSNSGGKVWEVARNWYLHSLIHIVQTRYLSPMLVVGNSSFADWERSGA